VQHLADQASFPSTRLNNTIPVNAEGDIYSGYTKQPLMSGRFVHGYCSTRERTNNLCVRCSTNRSERKHRGDFTTRALSHQDVEICWHFHDAVGFRLHPVRCCKPRKPEATWVIPLLHSQIVVRGDDTATTASRRPFNSTDRRHQTSESGCVPEHLPCAADSRRLHTTQSSAHYTSVVHLDLRRVLFFPSASALLDLPPDYLRSTFA
jgi:hypothetical protein